MNSKLSIVNFIKKPIIAYSIFWSWNFIFALFLIFTEINHALLFSIIKNAFVGYTPLDYSIYSLLIFLIPIGSIVLGLTVLRKQPTKLLKLFYGVELPLCLLFMLRLWLFREMTPSTFHLFLLLFFGIASYLSEILVSEEATPKWLQTAQKIGHSLLLIIGLYISIVILFHSFPAGWAMIKGFFQFDWFNIFEAGGWVILIAFFFFYTSTLFVFLPVALLTQYFKAFSLKWKNSTSQGRKLIYLTLSINIGLLFALNINQHQIDAFKYLDKDFSIQENKEDFYANEEQIKKGLLNAYLSSYRYISSTKESNHVKKMYQEVFSLSPESGQVFQDAFNFIMKPFLYDGDMQADREKAKELYAKYFDGSIQKNEQESVLKSLKSNWDSDGVEAGVLNVNQEKVHIERQEITINEQNDIADIEIYEVYKNKTFRRQEIFYYFSLPDNAVITGIWLSDDENVKKKYDFNVSPRGAAQKVYKAEVQKRVDPSLLEQVGPNQYRLRAFPIEPRTKKWGEKRRKRIFEEGDEFHLWLSYKTIIGEGNRWSLPTLSEKRNVYWDNNTTLSINGKEVTKDDNWLPPNIQSKYTGKKETHIASISESVKVKIEPKNYAGNVDLTSKKIAFLIDGSYSMKAEMNSISSITNKFNVLGLAPETPCFLLNDTIKELNLSEFDDKLNDNENMFFGTTTYMKLVNRFKTSNSSEFDLLILLTDKGNYEASKDSIPTIELSTPLYIMHVSNEKSPIYNDAFLETIRNSKGAIVNDISELITKISVTALNDDKLITVENGWSYSYTSETKTTDEFSNALASKYYIENLTIPANETRVNELDKIHQIALKEKIVTQYSSMIVLVNDLQKEALKKAEQEKDRFDREVENGDEATTKPSNPFKVTGTPEPHEWILIFIVISFLFYSYWKKKTEAIKQ